MLISPLNKEERRLLDMRRSVCLAESEIDLESEFGGKMDLENSILGAGLLESTDHLREHPNINFVRFRKQLDLLQA